MRFFAKKGDANFRALTANLREKYSRYCVCVFARKSAISRENARIRAKQQFRTTALFYQFT
jgi:hypothetical protein